MSVENLKFTIDGVEYTWRGGLGSIFSSMEKGLKKGDLRAINGYVFTVFSVGSSESFLSSRNIVHWTTVANIDFDWIRNFKKEIFS